MSTDFQFTKNNLDRYLKELGKEFRKLNGTRMPAEIILIGGAAILVNYGFREVTYDIDAVIMASSVMKEAINRVGDRLSLPKGWINADFKNTSSYSDKLLEISVYYKTFSNILTVRTVSAEYLVAMKLMSGRKYKNDLSDVVGILWEHQKNDNPITPDSLDQAVTRLYGGWNAIPQSSKMLIDAAFKSGDYESLYFQNTFSEKQSKDILLDFDHANPDELKAENIDEILEQAREKKKKETKER